MLSSLLSLFLVSSLAQLGGYGGYGAGGYGGYGSSASYGGAGGFGGYGSSADYGAGYNGYGNQFGNAGYRSGYGGTLAGSQGASAGYNNNRAIAAYGNSNLDYAQASRNAAEATNCAAYICVQFSDEHASGTDAVASYNNAAFAASGDASQGAFNAGNQYQTGSQFSNQQQQAAQYVVPTFPFYSLGYGYGQGSGFDAGYAGDYGQAAQNAAQYAQRVTQSNAANAGQKYTHDAQATSTRGGSCKQYVCASSSQLQQYSLDGPNYSSSAGISDTGNADAFQNGFASGAGQAAGNTAAAFSGGANAANTATFDGNNAAYGAQGGTAFGADTARLAGGGAETSGFSGFPYRRRRAFY